MSRNFGKNASGQLIRDETTNQAFNTIEKDLKKLNTSTEASLLFNSGLATEFEKETSSLSSTSSASDNDAKSEIEAIVATLKNLSKKIKAL